MPDLAPSRAGEERRAGRELDAAVCEALGATGRMTVYEWADRKKKAYPIIAFASVPWDRWACLTKPEFNTLVDAGGVRVESPNVPRPLSEDIAATWLVVEKMRERDWQLELFSRDGEGVEAQWWADFGRHGERTAATAPLAICLAALHALEAEP
jgi:hypothetical protein